MRRGFQLGPWAKWESCEPTVGDAGYTFTRTQSVLTAFSPSVIVFRPSRWKTCKLLN